MAEGAVSFFLEKLGMLIGELVLSQRVRHQLEEIRRELESMRACLRDADRRAMDHRIRTWVAHVRGAADEIEDIIDEYEHYMDRPQISGFRGFVLKAKHLPGNIYNRKWLYTRLQEMKVRVGSLKQNKDAYDFRQTEEGTSSGNSGESWLHDFGASLSIDGDGIIGMKKELDQIVNWLLKTEEPGRLVLPVTGMGGAGKTTVALNAFKDPDVVAHFDCLAFVSVSSTLRIKELWKSIVRQLSEANNSDLQLDDDPGKLQQLVVQHLRSKKYAIVLDDVWSKDDWEKIRSTFPDCKCGSRLVVTTRNEEVAKLMAEGETLCKLSYLNQEDASQLFHRKIFRKEPCPPELMSLAKKFVEKCGGLPLAIKAMGGLLLMKEKKMREWSSVFNNLNWALDKNLVPENLRDILLLSFNDLPFHLKHCFLYCSLFPENYPIKRKQLIRLWVGEGFVDERGEMTVEEVAEEYLKELVHRHMLLVAEFNPSGRVKACRMHDMMRELALSRSRAEVFSLNYDGKERADQLSKVTKVRHISIYNSRKILESHMTSSRLHSIHVLDPHLPNVSEHLKVSGFRLLRVLNLENVPIVSVPDELTDLLCLRYLNLRGTRITELPKCLGKLQKLQILDIVGTGIEMLPKEVEKLRELRHLSCYQIGNPKFTNFDYLTGVEVPPGVCQATSLQSLTIIKAEKEILRGIGNLTQLRRLDISRVRTADGPELCSSIVKMKHLIRLGLFAVSKEEKLDLEALSPNPPRFLEKLLLQGRLETVPLWVGSVKSLTHLWLHWSRLTEQDSLLPSLKELPELVFLHLHQAYEGRELLFKEGWFPKLKILHLLDLTELRLVAIEKGSMPCLQQLFLRNLRNLKVLPQGFEYLDDLQELILHDLPKELTKELGTTNEIEDRCRNADGAPLFGHFRKKEYGWSRVEEGQPQDKELSSSTQQKRQKMVLEIQRLGEGCDIIRSKTLKVIAACEGVRAVALEEDRRVVVIGEGVDPVLLVCKVRRKIGFAEFVSGGRPTPKGLLPHYYQYP